MSSWRQLLGDANFKLSRDDDGAVYLDFGEGRARLRNATVMIPKRGDRVVMHGDGIGQLVGADEEDPPNSTVIHRVEDHLMMFEVDGPEGQTQWIFSDASKAAARGFLRFAHPDAVFPLRRLSRAEQKHALTLPLGKEAVPSKCHQSKCQGDTVDHCTICERPMCRRHVIPCVVSERVHLVLGYCEQCIYFLLPAR